MMYFLGFLICAAFAALIISGLTQACSDILFWAEKRNYHKQGGYSDATRHSLHDQSVYS